MLIISIRVYHSCIIPRHEQMIWYRVSDKMCPTYCSHISQYLITLHSDMLSAPPKMKTSILSSFPSYWRRNERIIFFLKFPAANSWFLSPVWNILVWYFSALDSTPTWPWKTHYLVFAKNYIKSSVEYENQVQYCLILLTHDAHEYFLYLLKPKYWPLLADRHLLIYSSPGKYQYFSNRMSGNHCHALPGLL